MTETTELRPRKEIDYVVEARQLISTLSPKGEPGLVYYEGAFRVGKYQGFVVKDALRAAIWRHLAERFAQVKPSDVSAVCDAMKAFASPRG